MSRPHLCAGPGCLDSRHGPKLHKCAGILCRDPGCAAPLATQEELDHERELHRAASAKSKEVFLRDAVPLCAPSAPSLPTKEKEAFDGILRCGTCGVVCGVTASPIGTFECSVCASKSSPSLPTTTGEEELPPEFAAAVEEWMLANERDASGRRHGRFPLGMVGQWMERAKQAEAYLALLTEEIKCFRYNPEHLLVLLSEKANDKRDLSYSRAEVAALRAKVAAAERAINGQAGRCTYCGFLGSQKDDFPGHIERCEKHPLRAALARAEAAERVGIAKGIALARAVLFGGEVTEARECIPEFQSLALDVKAKLKDATARATALEGALKKCRAEMDEHDDCVNYPNCTTEGSTVKPEDWCSWCRAKDSARAALSPVTGGGTT